MTPPTSPLPSPCYLIDGDRVAARVTSFREAFERRFSKLVIAYSYKTLYVPALLKVLHRAGVWAEVVSPQEYALARQLGVAPDRIVYNGPIKPPNDVLVALRAGTTVHLDSLFEVRALVACARPAAERLEVGLRLNLEHPDSSDYRTRSRFGLAVDELAVACAELRAARIDVASLHVHLSTKRRDLAVVRGIARELGRAATELAAASLRTLDLGGGFGVAHEKMTGLSFPSLAEYADAYADNLESIDPRLSSKRVILEPGIAMVGDAVSYFAPVVGAKQVGKRRVLVVEGSVHTVKPTKHRHNLPITVLTPDHHPKSSRTLERCDVVGYTCMEDDYLAVDLELPPAEPGDLLRFDNVGGYTIVFKPPFIRSLPPIYLQHQGSLKLVRRDLGLAEFVAGYTFEDEP